MQHFRLLTIAVFILSAVCTYGQTDTARANQYMKDIKFTIQIGLFDTAAQRINFAYSTYCKVFGAQSAEAALALHYRGLYYYYQERHEEAIPWYDSSLQIRLRLQPKPYLDIAQSHNNLGLAYTGQLLYREALNHHREALRLREIYAPNAVEIAHSWANIGIIQGHYGEYDIADKRARMALSRLGQVNPKERDGLSIASVQNNLGGLFLLMGEPDSALVYLNAAMTFFKKVPAKQLQLAVISIQQNIGAAYLQKKQYANARAAMLESVKFCLERKLDHILLIDIYSNIGGTWIPEYIPDSSFAWCRQSLDLSRKLFGPGHRSAARAYVNLAGAYNLKERPELIERAGEMIDSAFAVLDCPQIRPSRLHNALKDFYAKKGWDQYDEHLFDSALVQLGVIREFRDIKLPAVFLDAAKAYTEHCIAQYNKYNHDIAYLRQAETMTRVADRYFDYCRAKLSDGEARQLIQSYAFLLYERGAYVQHLIRETDARQTGPALKRAFYYSEKSKALVLFESVRATKTIKINGVDSLLLKEEEKLRAEIAVLRQKCLNAANAQECTLLELKREKLDNLQDQLGQSRNYAIMRQNRMPISLADARQTFCNDSTTLLSYLAGDTSLFIFVVNRDTAYFYHREKTFPLKQWMREFRRTIEAPHDSDYIKETFKSQAFTGWVKVSKSLYDVLIAPVAGLLRSQVIVIPDGELCNLPFEALLQSNPSNPAQPFTWDFLVKRHTMQYCYSASLLREMSGQKHDYDPKKQFLGFAPWSDGRPDKLDTDACSTHSNCNKRGGQENLPCSGLEIFRTSQKFPPGSYREFYGHDATVGRFKSLASEYRIVHLSAHGDANEGLAHAACIYFRGDSLPVSEIYDRKLSADLVVLSSCKSNIGRFRRGEGVISMGRGFALAGARSVLTSLWYVNDCSTYNLMSGFYDNAMSGGFVTKSSALGAAKRMMAGKNTEFAHPYYWAGFLIIGDGGPLKMAH